VVGLAAEDRRRAVELLGEHDPGELMGERRRAEGERLGRLLEERRMEPLGTADQDRRPLRRELLPLGEPSRQLLGGPLAAAAVEGDEAEAGEAGLERAPFPLEDLRACPPLERLVAHLDDLQADGARQPALVLVRGRGERRADPPDDDDAEDG
jgi:hypothetical protein